MMSLVPEFAWSARDEKHTKIYRSTHSICVRGWPKALVVTCSTMLTPALSRTGLSGKDKDEQTSSDLLIRSGNKLLTEDIG